MQFKSCISTAVLRTAVEWCFVYGKHLWSLPFVGMQIRGIPLPEIRSWDRRQIYRLLELNMLYDCVTRGCGDHPPLTTAAILEWRRRSSWGRAVPLSTFEYFWGLIKVHNFPLLAWSISIALKRALMFPSPKPWWFLLWLISTKIVGLSSNGLVKILRR